MSRILVAGLPRSGTTWLAKILAEAPGVRYVNEPDNRGVDPYAWLATIGLAPRPALSPGQSVPDYRSLWELAFKGGWPDGRAVDLLRRATASSHLPRALRIASLRRFAKIAARGKPKGAHQLVKSVAAGMALEWIEQEFDPRFVIVWRHPLNLLPAWIDQGWLSADKSAMAEPVRARFQNTPAWPPPPGPGTRAVAWSVCAESVVLHETTVKHPDWIVVSHEAQCLNPATGFRNLYARLGLEWTDATARALAASDTPGQGFATNRRAIEEPKRWRARLSPAEQHDAGDVVHAFESVSPISAKLWRASPAVT